MDFFYTCRGRIFSSCKSTPEQQPAMNIFDTTSTFFTDVELKQTSNESKGISITIDENGYYDLLGLVYQIKTLLSKQTVVSTDSKREKLEWIIAHTDDAKEMRLARDELFKLGQQEQKVGLFDDFCVRARDAISLFSSACSDSISYDFLNMKEERNIDKIREQLQVLYDFLSICQEYASVKTNNKNHLVWKCCDNPRVLSDGCMNYCANCPATFETIDNVGTFNDQKRIATNSKPKYYNIKHFISAIKKSQGIHKKTIDPIVDKKQDEYMKHHGILLEDYTVKNLMDLLTRDSSLASYYKDVHLIYRQKTGKQVNNLSNVERDLPKWYREQDKLSETVKLREGGVNSINAYYMVCRLAQLRGGRIDLELCNFFCAKNPDTIREYDTCFEKRCYLLGWLKEGERLLDYCR
uniref:Uncharacterized protein n=1 Tax=viral metagenome TaxID=1070528 RepID=A0A6C0JRU6_9ZZZZ